MITHNEEPEHEECKEQRIYEMTVKWRSGEAQTYYISPESLKDYAWLQRDKNVHYIHVRYVLTSDVPENSPIH